MRNNYDNQQSIIIAKWAIYITAVQQKKNSPLVFAWYAREFAEPMDFRQLLSQMDNAQNADVINFIVDQEMFYHGKLYSK